jgi:ATP phosphoribosyltransferase regulatory subunit HisZ
MIIFQFTQKRSAKAERFIILLFLEGNYSGEVLGIRADMTPQVARIDAHSLSHQQVSRLCYEGTTLHTRGDALDKTRIPMQIGSTSSQFDLRCNTSNNASSCS